MSFSNTSIPAPYVSGDVQITLPAVSEATANDLLEGAYSMLDITCTLTVEAAQPTSSTSENLNHAISVLAQLGKLYIAAAQQRIAAIDNGGPEHG